MQNLLEKPNKLTSLDMKCRAEPSVHFFQICQFIIDREAGEIIRLVASVRLFVSTLLLEPFDL